MRKWFHVVLIAAFAALAAPDLALAWGPAVHIGLGNAMLEHLSLLPTAVAAILARNGIAYLYGNIAADVVFAKRLSRVKQFCHHWSTAFQLLDRAGDDQARAFAHGYLSHLAADSVAHGTYVPRQIIRSGCSIHFGHFYWELRADTAEPASTWDLLRHVLDDQHGRHHLDLEDLLTDTLLPYDLNRLLFDRMHGLALRKGVRRTMHVWSLCSRRDLPAGMLDPYRRECLERTVAVLSQGRRAAVLREDPNGTSSLMQLRVRRREMRWLKRRGLPVSRRLHEASNSFNASPTPGLCHDADVVRESSG